MKLYRTLQFFDIFKNQLKSPGNHDLSKELYQTFWEEKQRLLCNSITKLYQNGELSTSQRQAVMKLTEKKNIDKKLIKNWRPISLLSIDTKLFSKELAERLKKVLPSLISRNQTAYVKERFISEGSRLISDVLEISDNLKIKGVLMTIDSVNHLFLITGWKSMPLRGSYQMDTDSNTKSRVLCY